MMAVQDYISEYTPISLEEMDHVRLMNRTDIKYVFHAGLLPGILTQASQNYRMLTIGDTRLFRYNSLYYDTVGLKFYLEHHNGLRPRYKVRFREYVDTNVFFLEIKRKTNSGRTRKSRMKVEEIEIPLSAIASAIATEAGASVSDVTLYFTAQAAETDNFAAGAVIDTNESMVVFYVESTGTLTVAYQYTAVTSDEQAGMAILAQKQVLSKFSGNRMVPFYMTKVGDTYEFEYFDTYQGFTEFWGSGTYGTCRLTPSAGES